MYNSKIKISAVVLVLSSFVLSLAGAAFAQENLDELKLKDYRPQPIHKIPVTEVLKAKYPVIDMHVHVYADTPEEILDWIKTMDEAGVQKAIILTGATGERFDKLREMYSKYPERFELWCGLDYTDLGKPSFGESAAKELERCYQKGARGVGELVNKGRGFARSSDSDYKLHSDDPVLDPVWKKCAELGMPASLHVADPVWAYQTMDASNDGLMNAFTWRLDNQPGIVGFDGMIDVLERTVKRNPKTTFVACHLANLDFDLNRLAKLLDTYPNLYVDISARFGELASAPRASIAFLNKYADRVVYGTDQGRDPRVYWSSFRVMETLDEHFYVPELYHYHWNLSGFGLPDEVLKKIYYDTPTKVLGGKQ